MQGRHRHRCGWRSGREYALTLAAERARIRLLLVDDAHHLDPQAARLVRVLAAFNLFSSLPGIVLIHTIFGMPVMTLLFRNYYASIPQELFKAAKERGRIEETLTKNEKRKLFKKLGILLVVFSMESFH